MTQKIYPIDEFFLSPSKFFFSKNIFKVALQYLFNVFILFNIVFKLYFKLRKDPKIGTFKNLEKILKNKWQPCMLLKTNYIKVFNTFFYIKQNNKYTKLSYLKDFNLLGLLKQINFILLSVSTC